MLRACSLMTLVGAIGCASGGAGAKAAGPQGGECDTQLEPRQGGVAGAPATSPPRSAALSQIVVHADAPLAPLREELERRIPKQLAEGRVGIGLGGRVTYRAERGAVSLSVTRASLIVETPVQARAEACRGDDCYASCEPLAVARAEVPLMLGADYRFPRSSVTLRFTRGCKVRALGGFLTIDVTPTLQAELAPELGKVARDIDRQLPDVKREVEKAWLELTTPRPLPLLGCLVLAPSGIVQGPLSPSSERLQARFALLARPELRSACPDASTAEPLPPLQSDPGLPEEGTVELGLLTPLSSIADALQTASSFEASDKRLRVAHATARARSSDLDLELGLAGQVCGAVTLHAAPDFSGEGRFIGLSRVSVAAADRDRVAQADLDPSALAKAVQQLPQVPPLLSVSGFRDSAPALAKALSQRGVQIGATVSSARAGGAAARGADLVAWLRAQGRVTVELTELVH